MNLKEIMTVLNDVTVESIYQIEGNQYRMLAEVPKKRKNGKVVQCAIYVTKEKMSLLAEKTGESAGPLLKEASGSKDSLAGNKVRQPINNAFCFDVSFKGPFQLVVHCCPLYFIG
jgi:hypothetical protein